jgi:hypothetical protein
MNQEDVREISNREVSDHYYHAEASAVHGELKLPYASKIERQAHAKVNPKGGYESQQAKPFRVRGIVSYDAAHTQVAGHREEDREKKPAYKTLSTSLVEHVNILNVVTADRVVAQISTEHPFDESEGHVPSATFLGTQFHNLRIGGFPVEVELDLDLLDPRKHDCKIAITNNSAFTERLRDRLAGFREAIGRLREKGEAHKIFPDPEVEMAYLERYGKSLNKDGEEYKEGDGKWYTELSLVKAIRFHGPWTPIGNMFNIPHFGKVRLGVVRIEHSDVDEYADYELGTPPTKLIAPTTLIEVDMIQATMGCIASGMVAMGSGKTNGGPTTGGH